MSKILIFPLAVVVLGLPALLGQDTSKVKRVPVRATSATGGEELFREYCAVCHGVDLKGNGPAVVALKTHPGDLTQITRKNGGKYPELKVQRAIIGEDSYPAHGSADMPVWGPILKKMSSNPDLGSVRVYNLVKYIEQMQAK